ncbi:hypothetical protein YC2023_095468 [Brassica napus]
MSILHRFLSKDMTNTPYCGSVGCKEEHKASDVCGPICYKECPSICPNVDVTDLSPPPVIHHYIDQNVKRILIISTTSIITTLFLLTLLVLCFKWYNRRRSIALSRRWSMEEARNWDFDGPSPVIVDHPVWHIRTIGLNPTVISSIKVCKYSKQDGVVEGTDCSVCLSEFEEEETLRLLPKCRHAFHVPCIDTWLRSHTNCPVCRAPVVAVSGDDSEGVEEILVRIPEEESGELDEEAERGGEEEADEFFSIVVSDEEEEKSLQRVRRSVSLSSLSGLRVSEVVAAGRGKEKVKRGNVGSSGRSSFLKRSISYNGSNDFEKTHLRIPVSFRKKAANLQMMASGKTPGLTQEAIIDREDNADVFDDMKHRFLAFKKHKYMDNLEHFKKLADAQAPKFLVIACADSRVCPSAILGFQPGDAFTVRNIANLVPSYESGPTETKAALEFSVNTLNVENILIIGHSRCGGIQALMSMQGEGDSRSFIHNWVKVGKKAKESTKAVASNLHFDHQCQHCEEASINHSLERLLGYPWIEEKVRKGSLSLHGGYYDFVNCTFEKWTVDYGESRGKKEGSGIAVKNRAGGGSCGERGWRQDGWNRLEVSRGCCRRERRGNWFGKLVCETEGILGNQDQLEVIMEVENMRAMRIEEARKILDEAIVFETTKKKLLKC